MKNEVAEQRRYHHGALRAAMIQATDAILREQGIEGYTLRAAARRAKVSASATAHHFGNAAGLLTEVAILAYEELDRYLRSAQPAATPPGALRSIAQAYVTFALDHPGRFRLMFRQDLVDRSDERYSAASQSALATFSRSAGGFYGQTDLIEAQRSGDYSGILAAWSTAHGIAHLALEGKLSFAAHGEDKSKDFVERLLPAILAAQWPG